MRLVIDMQGTQNASRFRGIGRYSLALVQGLVRHRGDHEVILVLNDAFPETIGPLRAAFADTLPRENIRVWSAPGPTAANKPENGPRRRRAEAIYEAFLASLNPDIIHVTSVFEGFDDDVTTSIGALDLGIATSATLYDFIPLHDPDRFLKPNPVFAAMYRDKMDQMRRADLLLAISAFSAEDGVAVLGVEESKVVNVGAACSEMFKPSDMPAAQRAA